MLRLAQFLVLLAVIIQGSLADNEEGNCICVLGNQLVEVAVVPEMLETEVSRPMMEALMETPSKRLSKRSMLPFSRYSGRWGSKDKAEGDQNDLLQVRRRN